MDKIRNFCIIAHIEPRQIHAGGQAAGKTGVFEKREMVEQVLDSMELERERRHHHQEQSRSHEV